MKKIAFIALALALVILVSGCVGTQGRTVTSLPNDGLIIKEFSSDASRYANDEQIPLYIEIENVGGTTARNVNVEVRGASWSTFSQAVGTMAPPDLTVQPPTPGDFEVITPSLNAFTALPEGVEAPVTLWARVTYDYSSNGIATVNVINKAEYRRMVQMGSEIPKGIQVYNSKGPVHLDIDERGVDPVITDTTTAGVKQEVPIRIYINNVGSGAPISNDNVGEMTLSLSLQGLGATFKECMGQSYSSGTQLTITLRRGEKYVIPCKAEVDTPLLSGTFSVLFRSDYKYFVEQPLTVTLVGAPA